MRTDDFHYELADHRIAQHPLSERTQSRMLVLDRACDQLTDTTTAQLPEWLSPGDLLLFNDTRVIPARLFARKKLTGGQVEILVERVLDSSHVIAHLKSSKSPKPGIVLDVEGDAGFTVLGREGELFVLESTWPGRVEALIEKFGHMPLPPYIKREDELEDRERYQTVYARRPGAVAAPTAGLHFSDGLMETLTQKGVDTAFITLHVGAGTFQPVRVDDIKDHTMHAEWISVTESVCDQIAATHQRGGRVIAVGTTVVRALESAAAANGGVLAPYQGDTQIFIYPGYTFSSGLDALLTNFHLPQSTLLMLVSAFAGRDAIMRAYDHAVASDYRFFSYGDAMLIR